MRRQLFSTEDLFNLVMKTHNFHWDVEYGVYFFELLDDLYNNVDIDLSITGKPSRFKFLALVIENSKSRGVLKKEWAEFIKNILGVNYYEVIFTINNRKQDSKNI